MTNNHLVGPIGAGKAIKAINHCCQVMKKISMVGIM